MERVRKTFFDPLATSKERICEILQDLPVGSAHPFSADNILLCRTENGIEEIDISTYPEHYFFNAVDLGEIGEVLLRRMDNFKSKLGEFSDYQISQAPSDTFKVPLVTGRITILAVSERTPTYYDFCLADDSFNTCCWSATNTFAGIQHSGDVLHGNDFLAFIRVDKDRFTEKELCVFISGYHYTKITRFQGTHPALLVADHDAKALYIVPVPLDAATIGDAILCAPLAVKRDGDFLICSILSSAAMDCNKMCSGATLDSPCFKEALTRADFEVDGQQQTLSQTGQRIKAVAERGETVSSELLESIRSKDNAVIANYGVKIPSYLSDNDTQIIKFSTGLEFQLAADSGVQHEPASVVLPGVFGAQLEGPILLATGKLPKNVPFQTSEALLAYYQKRKNIAFIVNDNMMDNARNLASSYRMNAVFIVQIQPKETPTNAEDVLFALNSANVNAVTSHAGPLSLVLVEINDKYYFYRGIANGDYLDASKLEFGAEVTAIVKSAGIYNLLDPTAPRIINLTESSNKVLLPGLHQHVGVEEMQKILENMSISDAKKLQGDIYAAATQLQVLLNQKDLQDLSKRLIATLTRKIANEVAPLRDAYIKFFTEQFKAEDKDSAKKKAAMLGELRKMTKEAQTAMEPLITALSNMLSAQTTSKRTHDLKRLARQAAIHKNVDSVKTMTFEALAGYLETHATNMGVLLLNINTAPYERLLGNIKDVQTDVSECCDLDSRILYLEGLDAGLVMEQSQGQHVGPLQSQDGPNKPIMALPCLNNDSGDGSMLAWVCWDEFVDLESPYSVRWMEKCNEAHIAALRIMMRSTLSQAVSSREHNMQPGDPVTGHLMSALLMSAMSKLAATRSTVPDVTAQAEDTVTKLMRGLFGNLLTIAGSGVRPMSMVWQLFGLNPQYDVPASNMAWIWYENVVLLYPYTGWERESFYRNLRNLLDKIIVRVVTNAEAVGQIKSSHIEQMIEFCKLRNIQLEHSRTIITIFMRMLTTEGADTKAIAERLLLHLPRKLERQSSSYTSTIEYLEHLAEGGNRNSHSDLIAANTYTSRSAAFAETKKKVANACRANDWNAIKAASQKVLDKHAEIAAIWSVSPKALKLQNAKLYKDLIAAKVGDDIDQPTLYQNQNLTRAVFGDAEINRVPWQVGKVGQFGDNIEPLNEVFLNQILTGEKLELLQPAVAIEPAQSSAAGTPDAAVAVPVEFEDFAQFEAVVKVEFINEMQKNLSAKEACQMLKVPVSAMRVFVKALNPDFEWKGLGGTFKTVIFDLLKNRSNRVESRPVRRLLGLDATKELTEG